MAVQFIPRPLSDIDPSRRNDIYRIMVCCFHHHWLVDPEEAEAAWIAANGESEEWIKLGRLSDDKIWNLIFPYIST
jgi:hypothetical protein